MALLTRASVADCKSFEKKFSDSAKSRCKRGVVASVVKLRPARQIVFADALDGNLREVGIVHDLAAPDVRDRDDERLQPQGSGLGPVEERKQRKRDDRQNQHCYLQVGVGDDRLGIEFQELVSGIGG